MKYEIRTNCEYVIEIEANTEEEALNMAGKVDLTEWSQAWASMEVEIAETK